MKQPVDTDSAAAARGEDEVLLMRLGGLAFAVFSDEFECVERWAEPAPLPRAPAPVLGVVSVRGRMRTVIHPARLFEMLGHEFERRPDECAFILSLKGDEQLALAFETSSPAPLDDYDPHPDLYGVPVRATFRHGGETAYVLDLARLFDSAMCGTERRRARA
ncbi:MAG TPA: chemotaxis protein CheW [Pyrinomonadaceae bacterium]|jgi:chemotaxis signal transduction protein|nr:chemotaxis protein CheW [Pyrinomonadaceae bacterium]